MDFPRQWGYLDFEFNVYHNITQNSKIFGFGKAVYRKKIEWGFKNTADYIDIGVKRVYHVFEQLPHISEHG